MECLSRHRKIQALRLSVQVGQHLISITSDLLFLSHVQYSHSPQRFGEFGGSVMQGSVMVLLPFPQSLWMALEETSRHWMFSLSSCSLAEKVQHQPAVTSPLSVLGFFTWKTLKVPYSVFCVIWYYCSYRISYSRKLPNIPRKAALWHSWAHLDFSC